MSLIKSLQDLGRPVVFYPRLGRFFGSNNAAIFFAQLSYWSDRTEHKEGVYKTAAEWSAETGLTENEQRGARAKLKAIGGLVETHDRLNHRMYYRLDSVKIDTLFCEFVESENAKNLLESYECENHIRECENHAPELEKSRSRSLKITLPKSKNHAPEVRKSQSYKEHRVLTEMTTEMTTDIKDSTASAVPARSKADKRKKFDALAWLTDRGVSESVATDWLAVRESKGTKTHTETAMRAVDSNANAAGADLQAWFLQQVGQQVTAMPCALHLAVLACVTYDWRGFEGSWIKNKLVASGGKSGGGWSDRAQERREREAASMGIIDSRTVMPIPETVEWLHGDNFRLVVECDHE